MLLWLFDNCKRVFIGLKLKDGISGLIAFGEWKCIDEIKSCAASCLWFLGDILWLTSLISCSDVKSDIYITVKNQFDLMKSIMKATQSFYLISITSII